MFRRQARLERDSFFARPSSLGLVLGALAFLAALAPSLVPRSDLVQGVLAGLGFAVGYGVGVLAVSGLKFLELLPRRPVWSRLLTVPAIVLAGGVILFGLMNVATWQNGVRSLMGLPPSDSFSILTVAAVSLVVALILVAIGRVFRMVWVVLANIMLVILPPRAALLLGLVLVSVIFWSIGSGVLGRNLVDALDRTYANLDALIPPDTDPPESPLRSGSPTSLIPWDTLGAQGRNHMLAAPTAEEIAAFTGRPAFEPIRVYAGVNSARDPDDRARLVLEELIRTGGFDRANLVIATPTGTGWIDPAAAQPMEYLLEGDVATVSVQYSYLPSWLSLFVEPERGVETARAVFREVYGHWSSLPPDARPRLYLFGLSLGALNSDLSVNLYDILADPFDGALWVGPPFPSRTWNVVTAARDPDTPVWRPRFGDGRTFRFTTQENTLNDPGYAPWGPMRIIYLQYPSDAIVFFEPGHVLRAPAIVGPPRAPDIAPGLRWVPVVSWLQMVVDMMIAAGTPPGYGHVYAAGDYLDGWVALTDPQGWSAEDLDRLRAMLAAEGL